MLSNKEALDPSVFSISDTDSIDCAEYEVVEQAIKVLEAQKRTALEDIATIQKKRDVALADPVSFIYKLRDGTESSFPLPQKLRKLPDSLKSQLCEESSDSSEASDLETSLNFLESSPSPVKKIWNKKDQQQLVKLLKIYTDEYPDAERFAKISKAMGNRSVEQIKERANLTQAQDKNLSLPGYSLSLMVKGNLTPGETLEDFCDESDFYMSVDET